jgi:hypothetical protein
MELEVFFLAKFTAVSDFLALTGEFQLGETVAGVTLSFRI